MSFIALILLFLLLLLSLALGERLLGLAGVKRDNLLEQIVFSIGIGLTVLAYSVYLLGLLGVLYRRVLWFYVLALILILLPRIWQILLMLYQKGMDKASSFKWKEQSLFSYLVASFFILHAFFNLVGALAPETIFDAIWYHLALPKIYLTNHKIFFVPYIKYAAFPRITEMLYTLAIGLYSDTVAKLIHYIMGLLVAAAIYSFFRKYFSHQGGLLAAAIFYIMQPVNMLSQTAYIDLALTFSEFLAAYALANWWFSPFFVRQRLRLNVEEATSQSPKSAIRFSFEGASRKEWHWLILAGVFTGISLGVKHQAVLLLATISILLLLNFFLKERKLKAFLSNFCAFGFPAILIVLPWYIDSYLNTGNPFYPLFNTIFGTGESFEKAMFASTGKASWYAGHSLLEYFTLLWKFTMGHYEGWLSPLFLFFLPAIFLVKEKPKVFKLTLLYIWIFYTLYYAVIPFYTVRYFLPVVPLLSLIAAFLLFCLFEKEKFLRILAVGVVILTFVINLGLLVFKTLPAVPVVFGLKNRQAYLSETLVWYDVNRFIKENVPANHKILVGGAPLFYYFNFNYVYGSVPRTDSYQKLATKLKKQGFTHVLLLAGSLEDSETAKYFPLVYSRSMPPAVRSNATRGAKLYEIK